MTAPPLRADPPEIVADAVLIEQSWHEHEHERFAALFDRHASEMHRYVTRRLGVSTADDVVAETFLLAFRGRKRYDVTRADARPWLYGIASNLIGKHRRAEKRLYRTLARAGVDRVAESYADRVDARVTAEGVQRELADALAGLSAGDRDVLLLVAWADLTYEGVADALGIPVGTVRSRLHRARRKVREALGGVDPTEISEESCNG
ncbi:RNA polymerase sigma factor [Actinomadura alba]|nr:RNA polymerase sigma factor [Actinomadura alba]